MSQKLSDFRAAVEKLPAGSVSRPAFLAALAWAGYEENARQSYDVKTAELIKRVEALEAGGGVDPPPDPDPDPDPIPDPPPPTGTVYTSPRNLRSGEVLENCIVDLKQSSGVPGGGAGIFVGDGVKDWVVRNVIVRNCKFGLNRTPNGGSGRFENVIIEDTYDSGMLDQGILPCTYLNVTTRYCGVDRNGNATWSKYGGDPAGVHGWYLKSRSLLTGCKAEHSSKQGFSIRTTGVKLIDCSATDASILLSWHDWAGSRGPAPWAPNQITRFTGHVRAGALGMYCEPSSDGVPEWVLDNVDLYADGANCKGIDFRGHKVTQVTPVDFLGSGTWQYKFA